MSASKLVTSAYINKIEERWRVVRAWKEGDEVKTERELLGWFMTFHDWDMAIGVGVEPPPFAEGERVRITFERER